MRRLFNLALITGACVLALACTTESTTSNCDPKDTDRETSEDSVREESLKFPDSFDSIGPEVLAFESESERVIHYVDEGDASWTPFVFVGGNGTSVRVFAITEFVRSLRESLKIRIISVQRNGFGDTVLDTSHGYADFAAETEELLNHLGIDSYGVVAISGGGPYANELVARNAAKVTSVHMASAFSHQFDGESGTMDIVCGLPVEALPEFCTAFSHSPKNWFTFAPDSSIHAVPGLQSQALDDAARTFFMGDQMGAPDALVHEFNLYCNESLTPVPLDQLNAPVFIYAGKADATVAIGHTEQWQTQFGDKVSRTRLYDGEGHDSQYRHWDQILLDMAGHGDTTLVCQNGEHQMLSDSEAETALEGGATIGLCAWQN